MFGRISFYPTLLYNVFMEKVTARRWFDRIDKYVILGALPFYGMEEKLIKEENVKAVVSMNEDYELAFIANDESSWRKHGVEFLQLKTRDIFESPDQSKLITGVKFINKIIAEKNGSIYVHCKAGRTRSATLVGCYLIEKYDQTPEEAVNFIKKKRPHIWLRKEQLQALQTFYENSLANKIHSPAD